jgi:hypothetical protein
MVKVVAFLALAFLASSENKRYEGKWVSLSSHPFFDDTPKFSVTSSNLKLEIKRDSFFVEERFETDFHTEDPCTKWPQKFYYKGRIRIRNHYVELAGVATDSTYKTTKIKCLAKDSEISASSTFAANGDTIYFDFPRPDFEYRQRPMAFKRM